MTDDTKSSAVPGVGSTDGLAEGSDDLHDEIGWECADDPRYCGRSYLAWEDDIARPLLEAKGWSEFRWFTADGDSFGPLIRGVECIRQGERKTFYYG